MDSHKLLICFAVIGLLVWLTALARLLIAIFTDDDK